MLSGLAIWFLRGLAAISVVAAVLPLLPVGFWMVRLCDFPRIQLTALVAIPLTAMLVMGFVGGWNWEKGLTVAACLTVMSWQLGHVILFTPLWSKEVPSADAAVKTGLRVVVANLQVENRRHAEVLKVLEDLDPDLLLLIEVNQAWDEALEPLSKTLRHRAGVVRDEGLGIILLTRKPLVESEVRYLVTERRPSIFATVELADGQLSRFAGLHPTPPGLNDDTQQARRDSRVRDAELVLAAREVADQSDQSWIVTGDFNDAAWSHTTRLFKRLSGLRDPRVGRKLLNTYHANYALLRYPIDHVFVSDGFKLKGLRRVSLPGSDHFAILADLTLPTESGVTPEPKGNDLKDSDQMLVEGIEDAKQAGVEADKDGEE